MDMVEIIPAIMPESFEDLRAKAERVVGIAQWVQIDVMDGLFVTSRSWPYSDRKEEPRELEQLTSRGLPFAEKINYEVDLMVRKPEEVADDWVRAGCRRIIVHLESTDKAGEIFSGLQDRFADIVERVAAINVMTPIEIIAPFLEQIHAVQFMGIETIGYQGQPFDERVIPKIRALRLQNSDVIISVDGGVGFDTAPRLIEAGANRLVSGSAIFGSEDIKIAIEKLQKHG